MRQESVERTADLAGPDVLVAQLATRQHGVVSIAQLRAAGLSDDAVKRRLATGRLHRIYRGVYAVGHTALGTEGRWMAAVLASGDGAVVSHRSAAELWDMLSPIGGPIHVTVPIPGGRRRRPGIRLYRCPSLPKSATTRRSGIAVTTPARTIADLRRVASVDEVRRAIREAEFAGLDVGDEASREGDLTRSRLERRFLKICHRHRLPKPQVNMKIGPHEVDFLWREHRLVVEVDGWQGHRGRVAFEADRAKDLELKLLGYEVVRFTYSQVEGQPAAVAVKLRALLRRRT
jgi:very-short-patch-repair endonuclease